jgi:non-ribosomal peptide synthetase component F
MRPYEQTPLAMIQKWSGVEGHTPLFESLVVFERSRLNEHLQALDDGWQHRSFELRGETNYPLVVRGYAGRHLRLEIDYHTRRFSPDTVSRMLGHLETLLTGFTENPTCTLSQLPMLKEAERHQILTGWNNTSVPYPRDKRIHEIFEIRAAQTPDVVAIINSTQSLSYGELNKQANQLAHHLQTLGIEPGHVVGLCIGRTPHMIIALLALQRFPFS